MEPTHYRCRSILLAILVLGTTASALAQSVVLRDAAHNVGLIYDRSKVDGSIVVTETWSVGRTSRIVKSAYTEAGALTNRTVSTTNNGGSLRIEAVISPQGATITTTNRAGAGRPSNIPLLKRASVIDPSVRWFATDQPEKGASVSFMSFDPEYRYWEEVTVTYDGKGKLGNSAEGNLVTRKMARRTIHLVLDDKGLPIAWEDNQYKITR